MMGQMALINKLILIFFIAINVIYMNTVNIAWAVLLLLIYFCLNIVLQIISKESLEITVLAASMTLSVAASIQVSPLFILLLPLSIVELLDKWTSSKLLAFVLSVLPLMYVQQDIRPAYVLIALYTFFMYMTAKTYHQTHAKNEEELDAMRLMKQKLMKQIHNNDIYMKQSAYTFKLEERNRISQEIHDDIGHAITGALIQMEAAKRLLKIDQEKAEELLQNAIGITQDGIDNIRLTLKNMKPPLEQVGINRLKLYTDEFAVKHDKSAHVTYKGNMDLITPIQWKVIQENIHEALTNSLKYAGNHTQIAIDVTVLNKLIRVIVKDNGKGAAYIEKGLGIIGMEERTAAIDGKVIMDGQNGFSVTTLLPIKATPQNQVPISAK